VLILNNAKIHHGDEILELVDHFGVCIEYLPLYSSDLNLIEEAFSKIKHFIRQNHVWSVGDCHEQWFYRLLCACWIFLVVVLPLVTIVFVFCTHCGPWWSNNLLTASSCFKGNMVTKNNVTRVQTTHQPHPWLRQSFLAKNSSAWACRWWGSEGAEGNHSCQLLLNWLHKIICSAEVCNWHVDTCDVVG